MEVNSADRQRRVGLVDDDRMGKHATPDGDPHPENPDRIRAIRKNRKSAGIPQRCSLPAVEAFKSGKLPMSAPSKGYANTLIKGLIEGKQLSEEEATAYIQEASTKPL